MKDNTVIIGIENAKELEGSLFGHNDAKGLVIFAHGSGSSRHSKRNRFVAEKLRDTGLQALLIDLLTDDEESIDMMSGSLRFNIPFLAKRVVAATDWVRKQPEMKEMKIGYFGASTGGGAALLAATQRPGDVCSVVSRGGRPDLAQEALSSVETPTLLIVGGLDTTVIQLNQQAYDKLNCEKKLSIVPGASHLFEEPGALEKVAEEAGSWFLSHMSRVAVA